MRIGEWQDEKPTEPGCYFAMYGDVEVADNLSFFDIRRDVNGDLYDYGDSENNPIDDFYNGYQWAKVYLGSEGKELDALFPGTMDQLSKLTIKE